MTKSNTSSPSKYSEKTLSPLESSIEIFQKSFEKGSPDTINTFLGALTSIRHKDQLHIIMNDEKQRQELHALIKNHIPSEQLSSLLVNILCSTIRKDDEADYNAINNLLCDIAGDPEFQLTDNDKSGLIPKIIEQKSGGFDQELVDILIQKDLQIPSVKSIQKILSSNRFEGFAAKLAIGFVDVRNNASLMNEILKTNSKTIGSKFIARDFAIRIKKEQEAIVSNNSTSPLYFKTLVEYALDQNKDKILTSKLKKFKESQQSFAPEDQAKFLKMATQDVGHTRTFKILIENGINPLIQNQDGKTFLHHPHSQSPKFLEQYLDIIREMEDGQNVLRSLMELKDNDGNTPLDIAIKEVKYLKSVELLINAGAVPNYQHLLLAIDNKDSRIFNFLLNISEKNLTEEHLNQFIERIKDHKDPILLVVLNNFLEKSNSAKYPNQLNILKEIPQDKSLTNPEQLYFICEKLGSDYLNACLKNIENNANIEEVVNRTDEHSKTPLFYAIEGKCYAENVRILLANGANPNFLFQSQNGDDLSLVDLAIRDQHPEVLGILVSHKDIDCSIVQGAVSKIIEAGNATLTESFIKNMQPNHLQSLGDDDRGKLLEFLNENQLTECINRIKELSENLPNGFAPNQPKQPSQPDEKTWLLQNPVEDRYDRNPSGSVSQASYSQLQGEQEKGKCCCVTM